MKDSVKHTLIAISLIGVAVFWRLINYRYMILPNLEFITAGTLLAAAFLPKYFRVIVPLVVMIITDKIIGNTNIFIFTWSAFALIGIFSISMKKYEKNAKLIGISALAGLISSVFFFLFTNFGVWYIGGGMFYPHTLSGLIDCYLMGLPFYRNMLLGNLMIVPIYFAAAIYIPALVKYWSKNIKTAIVS